MEKLIRVSFWSSSIAILVLLLLFLSSWAVLEFEYDLTAIFGYKWKSVYVCFGALPWLALMAFLVAGVAEVLLFLRTRSWPPLMRTWPLIFGFILFVAILLGVFGVAN